MADQVRVFNPNPSFQVDPATGQRGFYTVFDRGTYAYNQLPASQRQETPMQSSALNATNPQESIASSNTPPAPISEPKQFALPNDIAGLQSGYFTTNLNPQGKETVTGYAYQEKVDPLNPYAGSKLKVIPRSELDAYQQQYASQIAERGKIQSEATNVSRSPGFVSGMSTPTGYEAFVNKETTSSKSVPINTGGFENVTSPALVATKAPAGNYTFANPESNLTILEDRRQQLLQYYGDKNVIGSKKSNFMIPGTEGIRGSTDNFLKSIGIRFEPEAVSILKNIPASRVPEFEKYQEEKTGQLNRVIEVGFAAGVAGSLAPKTFAKINPFGEPAPKIGGRLNVQEGTTLKSVTETPTGTVLSSDVVRTYSLNGKEVLTKEPVSQFIPKDASAYAQVNPPSGAISRVTSASKVGSPQTGQGVSFGGDAAKALEVQNRPWAVNLLSNIQGMFVKNTVTSTAKTGSANTVNLLRDARQQTGFFGNVNARIGEFGANLEAAQRGALLRYGGKGELQGSLGKTSTDTADYALSGVTKPTGKGSFSAENPLLEKNIATSRNDVTELENRLSRIDSLSKDPNIRQRPPEYRQGVQAQLDIEKQNLNALQKSQKESVFTQGFTGETIVKATNGAKGTARVSVSGEVNIPRDLLPQIQRAMGEQSASASRASMLNPQGTQGTSFVTSAVPKQSEAVTRVVQAMQNAGLSGRGAAAQSLAANTRAASFNVNAPSFGALGASTFGFRQTTSLETGSAPKFSGTPAFAFARVNAQTNEDVLRPGSGFGGGFSAASGNSNRNVLTNKLENSFTPFTGKGTDFGFSPVDTFVGAGFTPRLTPKNEPPLVPRESSRYNGETPLVPAPIPGLGGGFGGAPLGLPFGMPNFPQGGGSGRGRQPSRGKSRPSRYSPSLVGLFSGKTVRKAPGFLTGAEVRFPLAFGGGRSKKKKRR